MKKTNLFLFLFIFMLVTSSCEDEKTIKVRDIAKRFANAINNGDKETIYELFPEAKNLPNISMAKSIEIGNIYINYVDSIKEYIVKYGNKQEQEIEIKDHAGSMKIIDSYHVFKLDSIPYELALKTGVPVSKMSDIHLSSCMREGSTLMMLLQKKLVIDDILKLESKRIEWEYESNLGNAFLYLDIRNNGKKDIKGTDYKIEYSLFSSWTNENFGTGFIEGKDIASGDLKNLRVYVDKIDDGRLVGFINVKIKFVYNNPSLHMRLLKYGVWDGNEYNLSLKIEKMVD